MLLLGFFALINIQNELWLQWLVHISERDKDVESEIWHIFLIQRTGNDNSDAYLPTTCKLKIFSVPKLKLLVRVCGYECNDLIQSLKNRLKSLSVFESIQISLERRFLRSMTSKLPATPPYLYVWVKQIYVFDRLLLIPRGEGSFK